MKKITLLVTASFLLFNIGCMNNSKDITTLEDLEKTINAESKEQWEGVKKDVLKIKAEISAELDEIDSKLQSASEEVRGELMQRRTELLEWKNQADNRLAKFSDNINEDWKGFINDTKEYVQQVEEELGETIES